MNRVLFKAAAIVNIAAAALIYVACSGDDGKDGLPGTPGVGCVGTLSATVAGGIDITCGGVPAGTLQPGTPGAPGTPGVQGPPGGVGSVDGCYLQPSASGYDAICGGQNMGPLVTGGTGGGCTILDNPTNSAYLTITCGSEVQELAKAMCGTTAYDPLKWACDYSGAQPELKEHRCGTAPYNPLTQFCQAGSVKVQPLCGTGNEEYPATQFCQPTTGIISSGDLATPSSPTLGNDTIAIAGASALNGRIKDLCVGKKYAAYQFCYDNSTVYDKCAAGSDKSVIALDPPASGAGKEYVAGELCSGGNVQGNCGGLPYAAEKEFCQSTGQIRLLCGTVTTTNNGKYTADQFCQSQDAADVTASGPVSSSPASDVSLPISANEPKALAGKIKDYCVVTVSNQANKNAFGSIQFCQGAGTAAAKVEILCGDGNGSTSVPLTRRKEYAASKFCQYGTGSSNAGTDGFATNESGSANGKIKDKCGPQLDKTFGTSYYCSLAKAVEASPTCGSGSSGSWANSAGTTTCSTLPTGSTIGTCVWNVADWDTPSASVSCSDIPTTAASTPCGTHNGTSWDTPSASVTCSDMPITATNTPCGTYNTAGWAAPTGTTACSTLPAGSTIGTCTWNAGTNNFYSPETHFCLASSDIHPTCKPATAPATTNAANAYTDATALINAGLYDPGVNVCETRGNILYDYSDFSVTGGKNWILENARPNGVITFTWSEATEACPDGWTLPEDTDWEDLATATGGSGGSAGFILRAPGSWASYTENAIFNLFAAKPAALTGITSPDGDAYAYWWTKDEGGYTTNNSGAVVPGNDLNMGNYKYISELNTAIGSGGSRKTTTRLSVRCIK